MKQWMKVMMLACSVSISAPVLAGDAALYGAVAPADSGFFRVINTTAGLVSVTFNGKSFSLNSGECSDYAYTAPGAYTLTINGKPVALQVKTGSQQTVVWRNDGSQLLAEQPFDNKSKARVALYNLTTAPVSLLTSKGQNVVGPVAAGQMSAREVNAIQVSFSVHDSQKEIYASPQINLKRGRSTDLFVATIGGVAQVTKVETVR